MFHDCFSGIMLILVCFSGVGVSFPCSHVETFLTETQSAAANLTLRESQTLTSYKELLRRERFGLVAEILGIVGNASLRGKYSFALPAIATADTFERAVRSSGNFSYFRRPKPLISSRIIFLDSASSLCSSIEKSSISLQSVTAMFHATMSENIAARQGLAPWNHLCVPGGHQHTDP